MPEPLDSSIERISIPLNLSISHAAGIYFKAVWERHLNATRVASQLGVTEMTVRRWLKSNGLIGPERKHKIRPRPIADQSIRQTKMVNGERVSILTVDPDAEQAGE